MASNLPELPAVSRQEIISFGSLPIIEKLNPLVELDWRTSQYHGSQENSWEITKGNFNDGETIQVTAPAGREFSILNWSGLIVLTYMQIPYTGPMVLYHLPTLSQRHQKGTIECFGNGYLLAWPAMKAAVHYIP